MGSGQANKRNIVVPEAEKALDAMKYEIAAELGLAVGKQISGIAGDVEFATELGAIPASQIKEDYWGHVATRDAGAVGGHMTRLLVRKAEEASFQL
ncbi:alpha/beta-type small acid-soluble spore protein [Paenibacillus turpanensis]|uniref:alpha/beta-type small acid-soluble spore protein n=1 Tax=Paenibacillus turpanensis TaxID=2689078 RepID=UPI00140BAA4A|nr:alpha/beta-type small acid-soluble spore protein [Paenibacillus turpanensis]